MRIRAQDQALVLLHWCQSQGNLVVEALGSYNVRDCMYMAWLSMRVCCSVHAWEAGCWHVAGCSELLSLLEA